LAHAAIFPIVARLGKDFVPLFSRWRGGWFGTGQTLKGFLEEWCWSFGGGFGGGLGSEFGVRFFHKFILQLAVASEAVVATYNPAAK
jgi:hypothetical protein